MGRGRKKGYSDPNAWVNSLQADEAAAFYAEGHSVKETAERFGITKSQVNNLAAKRQISNGRAGALKEHINSRKVEAEKRIAKILPEFGLEYLGGYAGSKNKVRVKCLRCGAEYERTASFIYSKTIPGCIECKKRETKDKERAMRQAEHEKRKRVAVCDVCGKEFTTYNPQQKRCSTECSRAFLSKDNRLTESNTIDNNITLPRLYKRDEGICYICGLKCSWEDKAIRDDGVTIFGPTYPSTDHVIPIAKDGKHSWENVKLAHLACNIKKSDDITGAAADGVKVITSGRVLPKKTLQYDREGKLICTYSSTAEAAKATGFRIKQIQNCARGEKPTYRGYVWKYA